MLYSDTCSALLNMGLGLGNLLDRNGPPKSKGHADGWVYCCNCAATEKGKRRDPEIGKIGQK